MNCYHCVSRPATCIGTYEGAEIPAPACDECCGHACEDGWCIPTASLAEREPLVQEVIRRSQELDAMNKGNSTYPDFTNAEIELAKAATNLRKWKP